jgi:hypothetical protein|nr:MAG TPA: hypothetical protein [Caudoviricetes sp.]
MDKEKEYDKDLEDKEQQDYIDQVEFEMEQYGCL